MTSTPPPGPRSVPPPATVSTHILDTSRGLPASGVAVDLSVSSGGPPPGGMSPGGAPWTAHAASVTDGDGRCRSLPPLPPGTSRARLRFAVEPFLADRGAFFPEVAVAFAVVPGEHYHVPLLLTPFGYTVYRGS